MKEYWNRMKELGIELKTRNVVGIKIKGRCWEGSEISLRWKIVEYRRNTVEQETESGSRNLVSWVLQHAVRTGPCITWSGFRVRADAHPVRSSMELRHNQTRLMVSMLVQQYGCHDVLNKGLVRWFNLQLHSQNFQVSHFRKEKIRGEGGWNTDNDLLWEASKEQI